MNIILYILLYLNIENYLVDILFLIIMSYSEGKYVMDIVIYIVISEFRQVCHGYYIVYYYILLSYY